MSVRDRQRLAEGPLGSVRIGHRESGQRRERWTHRELGEAAGISASHAHVILSRADIKPHRTESWVTTDFDQPEFEARAGEVCGLYLDPPAGATSTPATAR